MSTPFDGDPRERDDECDDFAPRISQDEQGIDALLRAGGEQWRSAVPAVEFDRPSSRVVMLGRGPRVVLSLGIAAAVVAIVLAGSALVGRPAASVAPRAPTGGPSAVPTPMNSVSGSATTSGSVLRSTQLTMPPSSAPADISRLTEEQRSGRLVSTDVDPVQASKIFGAIPFPPVDSEVWTGWDVSTGELLVGVKDGNCATTFNGLRLADLHRLTLQVVRDNSDVGCERGWSVASFTPPSGFDPWIPSTLVTPLGTIDLASISGVVQNPTDDTLREAGSSKAALVGGFHDDAITVRWVPSSSALVITAPARCASSIARLASDDHGANLRILGAPQNCRDGSSGGSPVSVSVITPPRSEKAFTLEIAGRTFSVPAELLSTGASNTIYTDNRWVTVPAAVGKALQVSRVGRSSDGMVIIERACPAGEKKSFVGIQPHQTADQTVVLTQGGQREGCTNPGPGDAAIGSTYVLQPNTDPTEPLSIIIGDDAIQLPAVE